MKMPRKFLLPVFALLCLGFWTVGCDSGDSDDGDDGDPLEALEINPSSLEINTESPQTIVFSVTGGVPPYRWSVSNPELGVIESSGAQVVYESTTRTGGNVVMVLDAVDSAGSVVVDQF